ncbi:MAG: NUDIX hydrolase [Pseudonocardia sp.]
MSHPAVARELRVGAYVVCVQDGSVLLVRFSRSGRWTLPGGGIDHGERPEDAAVREVEEETGHRIELGSLIGIDSARWSTERAGAPVDFHAVRVLYLGEVVGGTLRDEADGSSDRAAWVPLADVAALDRVGLVDIGLAAAGTSVR